MRSKLVAVLCLVVLFSAGILASQSFADRGGTPHKHTTTTTTTTTPQQSCYVNSQGKLEVNVATQFGTNDTAVRNAVALAQQDGCGVYFTSTTFHYSGILNVNGLAIYGDGPTSLLIPDDHNNSAIKITGNSPSVVNLRFAVSGSVSGGDGGWGAAVWIYHATNALVDHITTSGTQGPPIFDEGSTGSKITTNTITQSMTGGIAFIAGSSNADVAFNNVSNCSDDMVSVVSDLQYPINHDISIHDNTLSTQDHGRGIAVVGGDHVSIQNNNVSNTYGAGIYVVSEGNYSTYGNSNITISNNTVRNPDQSNTHDANILIGSYLTTNSSTNVTGSGNNLDRIKPGVRLIGNYSGVNVGWYYGN